MALGADCWRGGRVGDVPAPGCRYRDTGVLRGVCDYGYNWSASFYDSGNHYFSMCLHFNATLLTSSNALYRGYGLQLRCLSE